MAWEARSGLKLFWAPEPGYHSLRRNGLGSPFGIETILPTVIGVFIVSRNGLGSPFGIETFYSSLVILQENQVGMAWEARSGLKQSSGLIGYGGTSRSEWPGKPVRD